MHRARLLRTILFGPMAATVLVSFAGCTLVGDTTTGVSVDRSSPSACIKACVSGLDQQVKSEIATHQAAVRACAALPAAEREECQAAEAARHAAAMAAISADRRECMNGCHRQGGGTAG